MRARDYIKNVLRTESNDFSGILYRLSQNMRKLHAVMGISTEAGELEDQLKKHIYYNKPLDVVNIEEELGDLFWYIAVMCHDCGFSFETIMDKNIAKLHARYPEKFTSEKAIQRDLITERKILEE